MNEKSKTKSKPLVYFLVLVMVLGVFSPYLPGNENNRVYAASETQHFINNHDIDLGPGFDASRQGAYQIEGADEDDMSAVAYCMDYSKEGPAGATYHLSSSKPDQVVSYLTAYGYPNRIFNDDKRHSRVITQIALWMYYDDAAEDHYTGGGFPADTIQEALDFLNEAEAYAADVKAGKKPAFSCGYVYTTTDVTEDGSPRQRILLTEPGKGELVVNKGYAAVPLTASNPNYSLSGAEYTVYGDSSLTEVVGKVTTNASGKSSSLELTPGAYYVKETKPSKGCSLDPKTYTVKVTTGNTASATSSEVPEKGKGKIVKVSAHTPITNGNESYSLKGAVYGVYKTESEAKSATKDAPGNPIVRLTTKEDGTTNEEELYAWDYYVKELEAPTGYALDTSVSKMTVSIGKTTTLKKEDMPQTATVDLLLQKVDAETKLPKAQGSASLKDAEYEVSYYAGQFNSEEAAKAAKVTTKTWIFKTDDEGKIKLDDAHKVSEGDLYKNADGKLCFPVGTVIIKESKAPTGYKKDNATYVHKIPAVKNGTPELEYGNEATSPEEVKRADMMGLKIGDTNMKRLAGVPFLLTSKTTGETHVIITDENGQFATTADWASRDDSTNTNDAAISEDGSIDESKLNDEAGIWFNGYNDPETGAPVKNTHRALPYDTYELKELRCEANKGYDLITFDFTVKKEGVINLGTLTDDQPEVPEIGTEAKDEATDGHIGNASETVTLVDTVYYDGLTKKQEYKLTGTLMDKATGEPIKVDGKPITAEKTFKPKSSEGTVDVEFTFPGSAVSGKTTVVFESLYYEDIEVAVHADIEDEDQTVIYPELKTSAALTKLNTITDKVSYTNLIPGKEYTMTATLIDQGTAKPISGATGTAKFVAKEADGTVDVTIDASKAAGKTVVVFEECKLEGTVVGEHKDRADENQMVAVPEIGTKAALADDNTIIDTVSYTNLETGKTYEMIAHLVDKETGKDITGTETKITLKVGEPSGKVDVAIDVSKLKGKTVVVFEECRLDGVLVAEHKDVKDRHQTVTVPKEHEPAPKAPTPSGSHPQTGDNSKPLLALGLIMASAMSIAMALKRRPGDGE